MPPDVPPPSVRSEGIRQYLKPLPWLSCGLVMEILAFHQGLMTPDEWQLAVLLHLSASPLLSFGFWLALPLHYRRPAWGSLLFLLLTLTLLPGVGVLGLALGVLPGLYGARSASLRGWDGLDLPDLPFRPLEPPSSRDPILREGLASVLEQFDDPKQRQKAILACRHLPRRNAVELLRLGLGDASDEVRLLAYSMLNGIERELDARILELSSAISTEPDPSGRRAEALALLYWEYCYLQLAQGNTAEYFLGRALTQIDSALSCRETPQRWLMRGRLLSACGDFSEAATAYSRCETLGMHTDDLVPHRAELAFRCHQFTETRKYLMQLSQPAAQHPRLRPLVEYWQ